MFNFLMFCIFGCMTNATFKKTFATKEATETVPNAVFCIGFGLVQLAFSLCFFAHWIINIMELR